VRNFIGACDNGAVTGAPLVAWVIEADLEQYHQPALPRSPCRGDKLEQALKKIVRQGQAMDESARSRK